MLRGVIFDIDGTLLASNNAHAQAWVETLTEAGYEIPLDVIWAMVGMGGDKLLPAASGIEVDSRFGKQLVARRWEIFREKYLPSLRPTPGARALAERLKADGLRLLVATSAKGGELDLLLDAADVADLMEMRSSSGGGKRSKPDPDIVQAAVRSSRLEPEELVMIADSPYDVFAALGAHVNVLAVLSGGWTVLELSGATGTYDDPGDILRWYKLDPRLMNGLAG